MSLVKKLPWASLALLLLTYGVFGWLFAADVSKKVLLWETALVLLIALGLTAGMAALKRFISALLKSDFSAFITIVVVSFVAVVILRWIVISIRILVLVSAGALVRLDLQTSGYSQLQSFLILAFVSLAGFGLGWMLNPEVRSWIFSAGLVHSVLF